MSADTIEKHHVVAFGRNLMSVPQTTVTKLVDCVDSDLNFTEPGTSYTDPLIGKSNPQLVTDRFGDSPTKAVGRSQRGGYFYNYEDGNFLDSFDQASQLVDPANPVVTAMAAGVRRSRDDFIIAMAQGAVREGQSLENSVAFPSGNSLASGSTGLTVAKLITISTKLDNGEVEGERYYLGGATDKASLLGTTQVTSSDYNTIKALVNGEVNTFMGFTFKWLPDGRIPLNGSSERLNMAWVKPSLVYRARPIVGGENATIKERADKKNAWYAYLSFRQAGHRRYDEGVVIQANV